MGLFFWTASRTLLKVMVKFVVYMLNFCCLCTFDIFRESREKKRLSSKSGKKMYTRDLLQIIGNPNYNPIADPKYDLDKYSKVCAGIMFLCEGEVLLLQRNSNNNDLCFDVPGGTLDFEDFFPQKDKETDKQNKDKKTKDKKHKKETNDANAVAIEDSDSPPYSHHKRPIYPTIPLYDSFYFADLFSAQFQQLGIQQWQHKGVNKRQQLERLHEQSIRHMHHGFGFDSATWQGAVRECREEIGTFPSTITPLAVFNLYRGWSNELDTESESDSDSNSGDDSDTFDIESQTLINAQTKDDEANNTNSVQNRNKNINVALLGNGKVISENFRRYTLYVCSITPEQRNEMKENIRLSEEHICYGFFPLCLLVPMQATTISTFRHFRIHPWLVSFIEQYSGQFDKLSRKVFWVGYNRHFDSTPQLLDGSTSNANANSNAPGKKGKKGGKKAKQQSQLIQVVDKNTHEHPISTSGADGDISSNSNSPRKSSIQIQSASSSPTMSALNNKTDDIVLNIFSLTDQNIGEKNLDKPINTTQDVLSTTSDGVLINFSDENITPDEDHDEDGDDDQDDNDDGKKNKGDKKKNKDKNKEKKGKKSKEKGHKDKSKNNNQDSPATVTSNVLEDAESALEAKNTNNSPTPALPDITQDQNEQEEAEQSSSPPEEHVEFDTNDVFISTFLPLVKKHINPQVYI